MYNYLPKLPIIGSYYYKFLIMASNGTHHMATKGTFVAGDGESSFFTFKYF